MVRNLLPLFEILAYVYCLAAIYGNKVKYNIYTVILIVTEMILMLGINEYELPTYLISISYVLLFIYCFLNYRLDIKQTLVNLLLAIVTVGILQLIIYFILVTISRNDNIDNISWEVIIMFACMMVFVLFGTKMKLNVLANFLSDNKWIQRILCAFIMVIFASRIWKMKVSAHLEGQDFIFTVYFFGVVLLLLIEWQKTKADAEKRKIQLEMNNYYYDTYKELISSIRDKRHDFKNHINAIRGMLYTTQNFYQLKKEEEEYLNDIMTEIQEIPLITMIENPLISGFISVKIQEAKSKGIEVTHYCRYPDVTIKIPEYVLIEMMGILLDNAIEATENLEHKKIKINMTLLDNVFDFSVVNTCKSENTEITTKFFERGYSSKGSNSGLGLAKIKGLVQKYRGDIWMSEENIDTDKALKFAFTLPL